MADTNINCPKCHEIDKVTKVSAIVARETTTTSGTTRTYVPTKDSGYWDSAAYSETHTSNLAKSLLPPKKPQISTSSLAGFLIAGLVLICLGSSTNLGKGVSPLGYAVIFFALFLMVLGLLSYNGKAKEIRDMLPRWEKAMERWNQLYYCGRDETIFNPYDGTSTSIENLEKYLYS